MFHTFTQIPATEWFFTATHLSSSFPPMVCRFRCHSCVPSCTSVKSVFTCQNLCPDIASQCHQYCDWQGLTIPKYKTLSTVTTQSADNCLHRWNSEPKLRIDRCESSSNLPWGEFCTWNKDKIGLGQNIIQKWYKYAIISQCCMSDRPIRSRQIMHTDSLGKILMDFCMCVSFSYGWPQL